MAKDPFPIKVSFEGPLLDNLKDAEKRINKAVAKVIEKTAKAVFLKIKFATPTRRTTAFAGWRLKLPPNARTAWITNKVPYINVLEFGGYPVRAKKNNSVGARGGISSGGAYLGGDYEPGPSTMRSQGGEPEMKSNVSVNAPKGMVRQALAAAEPQFIFDLEEGIDVALAGEGEV